MSERREITDRDMDRYDEYCGKVRDDGFEPLSIEEWMVDQGEWPPDPAKQPEVAEVGHIAALADVVRRTADVFGRHNAQFGTMICRHSTKDRTMRDLLARDWDLHEEHAAEQGTPWPHILIFRKQKRGRFGRFRSGYRYLVLVSLVDNTQTSDPI